MQTVTQLFHEQIARFSEFIEKWTEIGLCAQPADRMRAEQGIRLAYATAHLTTGVGLSDGSDAGEER